MNAWRGALAATALTLVLPAGAASAHTADIFGWAKNDYLCTAARCTSTTTSTGVAIIDKGNLVGFWQNIMSADGFASVCTSNGIDGHFGSRSAANTRAWQSGFGLAGVDGIAGPETWGYAQTFEIHNGVDGTTYYKRYNGVVRDFTTVYPLENNLSLYWEPPAGLPANGYVGSGHPVISFGTC